MISALNNQATLLFSNHSDVASDGIRSSIEKLSSGRRINRSADDAAGVAISSSMTSIINGLNTAVRNVNDACSLCLVADGGVNQVADAVQRLRELAVQSSNGTLTDAQRDHLQLEADELTEHIDNISESLTFNQKKLIDGTFDATFQSGWKNDATLSLQLEGMDPESLSLLRANDSVSASIESFDNEDGETISFDIEGVSISFEAAGQDDPEGNASSLLAALTNESSALSAAGVSFSMNSSGTGIDLSLVTSDTNESINIENYQVSPAIGASEEGLVGQSGVVRVNFAWDEDLDLDPVVVDPDGDSMGYHASVHRTGGDTSSSTTSTGGEWDVDDTGDGSGLVDNPNQENFFWESSAPTGEYSYYIKNYSNSWPGGNPVTVDVTIKTGDTVTVTTISIPVNDQEVGPFTFNYDGDTGTSEEADDLGSTLVLAASTDSDGGNTLSESTPSSSVDATRKFYIHTAEQARLSISDADEAISIISTELAKIGAFNNLALEVIDNNKNTIENTQLSRSRIQDADFAKQTAELARNMILSETSQSMLNEAHVLTTNLVKSLIK